MNELTTFNRGMIKQYLDSVGLRYMTDTEGDFHIFFGYQEEIGCSLTITLAAQGRRSEIYVVRAVADKHIPKQEWGKAIMLCNTYNRGHRWPKAYLYVRDPNDDATVVIMLEEQIDLEKGIHQALFDDFTHTVIASVHTFWTWAHGEQAF